MRLTAEQRAERLAEIRAIASLVHGGPDMVNMRFLLAEIDRLTAERDTIARAWARSLAASGTAGGG